MILISNDNTDFAELLSNSEDNEHFWLQLWPVTHIIPNNKVKNLKIFKYSDFIFNQQHYDVESDIKFFTKEVFKKFRNKKFKIEGLSLDQIFAYELEQPLSKLFFILICIDKFLKSINRKETVYLSGFYDNDQTKVLGDNFYKTTFIKILKDHFDLKIQAYNNKINNNKSLKTFIKTYNLLKVNLFSHGFKTTLYKVINKLNNKIYNNSIIISNSTRCLENFYNYKSKNESIYILSNSYYKKCKHEKLSFSDNNKVFFRDIDLSILRKSIINYCLDELNNLKIFYSKIQIFVRRFNPKYYVTIDIMSSKNLVKMWAFKNEKVKIILSSESLALTSADEKLMNVLSSVLHPEINDIDRWVVSNFSKNNFHRKFKNVFVSGYLGKINQLHPYNNRKNKNILFCLSGAASNKVTRAVQDEDMFGILHSVKIVTKVVSTFASTNLIIKTHPGENKNIPLYENITNKYKNTVVKCNANLSHLLSISEMVILYDTSVALEALSLQKPVICFNYLGRPSNFSAVRESIIKSKKIDYLSCVNNEKDLKSKISEFLNKEFKFQKSNLSDYMENLNPNYDISKIDKYL